MKVLEVLMLDVIKTAHSADNHGEDSVPEQNPITPMINAEI